MKETGVVRHLDELGRIVIPKEIRRNLRMNEGDLLEIFVDEGESVVFLLFGDILIPHNIKCCGEDVIYYFRCAIGTISRLPYFSVGQTFF